MWSKLFGLITAAFIAGMLCGCHAVEGVGRDLSSGAQTVRMGLERYYSQSQADQDVMSYAEWLERSQP